MPSKPKNLLIIMADEHNPKVAGYAGHSIVHTPSFDRMASNGTWFSSAYTPSPICVPARASFATGLPVHRNGAWDNAIAYDGKIPSWHKVLRDRGHNVSSIGKLHYRGHPEEDYGLTDSQLAMHIANGVGDVTLLIRDPDYIRTTGVTLERQAKPGESNYTLYDRQIAAEAQIWLHEIGTRKHDKPWVLYVSMMSPHFPLTAPPEHFYRYANQKLPRPKLYGRDERPDHPYVRIYGRRTNYDDHIKDEAALNRVLAGYFGLVSFMDEQVGKILAALTDTGLADSTRVIYTSDHGDNLGARGLWGKSTMYEESAGIPLLMSGPDVPRGTQKRTPVGLLDVSATILDAVGARDAIADLGLPGQSLLDLASGKDEDRAVLSEFHTMGPDAFYMLRTLRYKYVHYVNAPPQLFDMESDPEELTDLGQSSAHASVVRDMEQRLRQIVDPEATDRRAKADQAAMIARHGGEAAVRARESAAFTPAPTRK